MIETFGCVLHRWLAPFAAGFLMSAATLSAKPGPAMACAAAGLVFLLAGLPTGGRVIRRLTGSMWETIPAQRREVHRLPAIPAKKRRPEGRGGEGGNSTFRQEPMRNRDFPYGRPR